MDTDHVGCWLARAIHGSQVVDLQSLARQFVDDLYARLQKLSKENDWFCLENADTWIVSPPGETRQTVSPWTFSSVILVSVQEIMTKLGNAPTESDLWRYIQPRYQLQSERDEVFRKLMSDLVEAYVNVKALSREGKNGPLKLGGSESPTVVADSADSNLISMEEHPRLSDLSTQSTATDVSSTPPSRFAGGQPVSPSSSLVSPSRIVIMGMSGSQPDAGTGSSTQKTARQSARIGKRKFPASDDGSDGKKVTGKSRGGVVQRTSGSAITEALISPRRTGPSTWLTATMPHRIPYVPQIGDILCYYKVGHRAYQEDARTADLFDLVYKDDPDEMARFKLNNMELVQLTSLKVGVRKSKTGQPIVLCELSLTRVCKDTLTFLTPRMTFRVLLQADDLTEKQDFLVLYQFVQSCGDLVYTTGQRVRKLIRLGNDQLGWRMGVIKRMNPGWDGYNRIDATFGSDSLEISRWEIHALADRTYDDDAIDVPLTKLEVQNLAYKPDTTEWADMSRSDFLAQILPLMDVFMKDSRVEPFCTPVDLVEVDNYVCFVGYIMDFSLMKRRLENGFYRRIAALIFDARLVSANAKAYHGYCDIYKQARAVAESFVKIISDPEISTAQQVTSILDQAEADIDTHQAGSENRSASQTRSEMEDQHNSGAADVSVTAVEPYDQSDDEFESMFNRMGDSQAGKDMPYQLGRKMALPETGAIQRSNARRCVTIALNAAGKQKGPDSA